MQLKTISRGLVGFMIVATFTFVCSTAYAIDLQETRKTTAASAPPNAYKVISKGTGQSVECFNVTDPKTKKLIPTGTYKVIVTFESGKKQTKTITFTSGNGSFGACTKREVVKDVDVI